jgi:hypothetical protein
MSLRFLEHRPGFQLLLKFVLASALFFSLISCKKEEKDIIPANRPPQDFIVAKPELRDDGRTIVLWWTPATDPDGDIVSYTVVLTDTLVKDLLVTTYTLTRLPFDFKGEGSIIAKDTKGNKTIRVFKVETEVSGNVKFVGIPDPAFEKLLIWNSIDRDGQVNGKVAEMDVERVQELNAHNRLIKSLKGI